MGKTKPFAYERRMVSNTFKQYCNKLGHPPTCKKCDCPISIGDVYHRNQAKNGLLYCDPCYKGLFIETPDLEISDSELDSMFSAVLH